jgi:broad specificity phosphatase PhoE
MTQQNTGRLKKLIIVRHGDYSGEDLTKKGRDQIEALSLQIKALIRDCRSRLFTSPAPRARQSANILYQSLGKRLPGNRQTEHLPAVFPIGVSGGAKRRQ